MIDEEVLNTLKELWNSYPEKKRSAFHRPKWVSLYLDPIVDGKLDRLIKEIITNDKIKLSKYQFLDLYLSKTITNEKLTGIITDRMICSHSSVLKLSGDKATLNIPTTSEHVDKLHEASVNSLSIKSLLDSAQEIYAAGINYKSNKNIFLTYKERLKTERLSEKEARELERQTSEILPGGVNSTTIVHDILLWEHYVFLVYRTFIETLRKTQQHAGGLFHARLLFLQIFKKLELDNDLIPIPQEYLPLRHWVLEFMDRRKKYGKTKQNFSEIYRSSNYWEHLLERVLDDHKKENEDEKDIFVRLLALAIAENVADLNLHGAEVFFNRAPSHYPTWMPSATMDDPPYKPHYPHQQILKEIHVREKTTNYYTYHAYLEAYHKQIKDLDKHKKAELKTLISIPIYYCDKRGNSGKGFIRAMNQIQEYKEEVNSYRNVNRYNLADKLDDPDNDLVILETIAMFISDVIKGDLNNYE